MNIGGITKTIPTMMAAGLAGRNIALAKKKKKRASDFLRQGTENVVGVSLISSVAAMT